MQLGLDDISYSKGKAIPRYERLISCLKMTLVPQIVFD